MSIYLHKLCFTLTLISAFAGGAGFSIAAESPLSTIPPSAGRAVDFDQDVAPIFQFHCVKCHGPQKSRSGLRLDSHAGVIAGGDNHSPGIKTGNALESALFRIVAGLDSDLSMPPAKEGTKLKPQELSILRAWIEQGAKPGEKSATGNLDASLVSHWAFKPVRKPVVPATREPNRGAATALDAFVRARLKAAGLDLSPEANKTTLARRLWMVMLGVPPSPAEMDAFLQDKRADAFERLVDAVLNDPRYGERWARHWLDVIRFAESNGFETNRERLNSWKFRDYVIEAFNADKPYDQFVREQIAGDASGNEISTGFLVAGPVDIVGSPDPVLTAQQRADEIDDMVSTTGSAFLGLTLGCARCHSHKFDPIPQKEYYSMAAIFAGVRHGERPLPTPSGQKLELTKLNARVAELEDKLRPFLSTAGRGPNNPQGAMRPAVNPVSNEETLGGLPARWVRFTIFASSGGEPCIDELEIWAGTTNVALASRGVKASASGTLPGFEIHKLEHIHDGKTGNNHSWISNESGRGWIQLELPSVEKIDRIAWGRDREGRFKDRIPIQYKIEVATQAGKWKQAASSEDRMVFATSQPKVQLYRFDGLPDARAEQGRIWLKELESVRKDRDAAARPPMAYSGTFSQPGETFRLHRGDPMQKKEQVAPATLSLFSPVTMRLQEPEQNRRVQLANWIASPENPLTVRVLVNRIWQHQFGTGLVETPNDFGMNGARPTNPELLDWLSAEFMAGGWSIKKLQRTILLSATWRQSSAPRPAGLKIDAASRLLWRFPPRRIEAEGIRDSILAVSGSLNPAHGGPAFYLHDVDRENVYHYQPKEQFSAAESRRMIYAFKVRMEQDGIFGAFDCPDGSLVAPKRSISTTPLQALNLFNSQFLLDQAEIFSKRLIREAGAQPLKQIQLAWRLAFNRNPTQKELKESLEFVAKRGLAPMCRAILNANEFVFIP